MRLRRRLAERAATAFALLSALVAGGLFAGIAAAIFVRGRSALSWEFLTAATSAAGAAGGIVYQLAGTLILVATALAAAVPPAVAVALLAGYYLPAGRARRRLRLGLYLWNGIPSIVAGIFGLIVFLRLFGWGKSWLAGGLVLGWMILPTVTVALLERIEAIPAAYLDSARALGLTRARTALAVVLPQSRGGLVSGALLGLARAAGETAPILFTAAVFSGVTLPSGVRDSPVLALPYHVFVLAQDSFDPAAGERLWGAALVLLALVAAAAVAALPVRLASHEEARHA